MINELEPVRMYQALPTAKDFATLANKFVELSTIILQNNDTAWVFVFELG